MIIYHFNHLEEKTKQFFPLLNTGYIIFLTRNHGNHIYFILKTKKNIIISMFVYIEMVHIQLFFG